MSSVIAPKYPLLPPLDSGAISLPLSHRGADFNAHNLKLVSRPVEGTTGNSNGNNSSNGGVSNSGNGSSGSAASNSSRRATLSAVPPPPPPSSSSSSVPSSSSSFSSAPDMAAMTKTVSAPSLNKINGKFNLH